MTKRRLATMVFDYDLEELDAVEGWLTEFVNRELSAAEYDEESIRAISVVTHRTAGDSASQG